MRKQHTAAQTSSEKQTPWEQINAEKASVLTAALNDYKSKTFGRELAIIADLEVEIPQAFDTVEMLYQQRDELLAALKLVQATKNPFATIENGGLGLEYTSENLFPSAWEFRAKYADDVARAAIAKATGDAA